jgi:hypothetical protein
MSYNLFIYVISRTGHIKIFLIRIPFFDQGRHNKARSVYLPIGNTQIGLRRFSGTKSSYSITLSLRTNLQHVICNSAFIED